MKLRFAAAYVDESETKFLQGVKAGKWPQGSRDGGNVYWFIEDLDAALDRLKPVGARHTKFKATRAEDAKGLWPLPRHAKGEARPPIHREIAARCGVRDPRRLSG